MISVLVKTSSKSGDSLLILKTPIPTNYAHYYDTVPLQDRYQTSDISLYLMVLMHQTIMIPG